MKKLIIPFIILVIFASYHIITDFIQESTILHECKKFGLPELEILQCAASPEAHEKYSKVFFENWKREYKEEFLSQITDLNKFMISPDYEKGTYDPYEPLELSHGYEDLFNGVVASEKPIGLDQKISIRSRLEYVPRSLGTPEGFRISLPMDEKETFHFAIVLDRLEESNIELIKKYCIASCPSQLYGHLVRLDKGHKAGVYILGLDVHAIQFFVQ